MGFVLFPKFTKGKFSVSFIVGFFIFCIAFFSAKISNFPFFNLVIPSLTFLCFLIFSFKFQYYRRQCLKKENIFFLLSLLILYFINSIYSFTSITGDSIEYLLQAKLLLMPKIPPLFYFKILSWGGPSAGLPLLMDMLYFNKPDLFIFPLISLCLLFLVFNWSEKNQNKSNPTKKEKVLFLGLILFSPIVIQQFIFIGTNLFSAYLLLFMLWILDNKKTFLDTTSYQYTVSQIFIFFCASLIFLFIRNESGMLLISLSVISLFYYKINRISYFFMFIIPSILFASMRAIMSTDTLYLPYYFLKNVDMKSSHQLYYGCVYFFSIILLAILAEIQFFKKLAPYFHGILISFIVAIFYVFPLEFIEAVFRNVSNIFLNYPLYFLLFSLFIITYDPKDRLNKSILAITLYYFLMILSFAIFFTGPFRIHFHSSDSRMFILPYIILVLGMLNNYDHFKKYIFNLKMPLERK